MKKLSLLSLIPTVLFTGCNTDIQDEKYLFEFDEAKFKQEKKFWDESNFQNYSYTYSSMSSSTGPIENNVVVTNGVAIGNNPNWNAYTISEIYKNCENVANSYLSGSKKNGVSYHVSFSIKYDEQYHYPQKIHFTVYNAPPGGGGYDIELSDFKILE